MELDIKANKFILDGSGALFWKNTESLLLADLHLGKITHFRKNGSALPLSAVRGNFAKLDESIRRYRPRRLIFLGDLFHSESNAEGDAFGKWCGKQTTAMLLLRGNHDILDSEIYQTWGLELSPFLEEGGFLLSHKPVSDQSLFNICGHIHPAVRLEGLGHNRLRLPCFYQTDYQLILPAYGTFTGSHTMRPQPKHKVFALAEGAVIQVN